jgi:predicted metal-dependent hydrolase
MQETLTYEKREFIVEIQFNRRKTFSITVYPNLRIVAKAPLGFNINDVRKGLNKRASWISKKIDYFDQFQPLPPKRQYINGETHYYLGQQYRLKINRGKTRRVKLIGVFFQMELPDPSDREKVKKTMQDWYSSHAKEILTEHLEKLLPKFTKLGVVKPEVRFRRMKRRWGSCSQKGVIMLNTELVKTPIHCINYVIVHELCHLKHLKHNKEFYNLLRQMLPDWEQRKKQLEKAVL